MKQKILIMAAVCSLGIGAVTTGCEGKKADENPFLSAYDTPYEIPPFDKIKTEH